MSANPILRQLGLSDTDRVVLLHTDDIGMSHASVSAYADLLDFGLISTAGIMVPCPWFIGAVEVYQAHADHADLGVHSTLNAEYDTYRWPPLSTVDPASGLIDAQGYLPRTRQEVAGALPDAVRRELETQVQRALAAGIDVTHIDTHMGSVFYPPFALAYVETALKFGLPPMLPRITPEEALEGHHLAEMGMSTQDAANLAQQLMMLEEQGLPLLDGLWGFPLESDEDRLPLVKSYIDSLRPGVYYWINHAAKDTPELRAATPSAAARAADFRAMTSPAVRQVFRDKGIHIIGWRVLRDAMRARLHMPG